MPNGIPILSFCVNCILAFCGCVKALHCVHFSESHDAISCNATSTHCCRTWWGIRSLIYSTFLFFYLHLFFLDLHSMTWEDILGYWPSWNCHLTTSFLIMGLNYGTPFRVLPMLFYLITNFWIIKPYIRFSIGSSEICIPYLSSIGSKIEYLSPSPRVSMDI